MNPSPLPARPPLSLPGLFSLSHFRASRPQPIHRLPIFRPLLLRVVHGIKRLYQGNAAHDVGAGQLIVLPARIEIDLMNIPGPQGYLAEVMGIAPDAIEAFREKHAGTVSALLATPAQADLRIVPGPELSAAWEHITRLWQPGATPPPAIARHRLEEVLLSLALQGAGQGLFYNRRDTWSERVRILLQLEPARKWTAADIAHRLQCSEATLRRHLAAEDCSLRKLLDAIRMNTGFGLILNTQRRVDDIALACGYDSASRFSIRFRQRFGVSPTEMRATR